MPLANNPQAKVQEALLRDLEREAEKRLQKIIDRRMNEAEKEFLRLAQQQIERLLQTLLREQFASNLNRSTRQLQQQLWEGLANVAKRV